MQTTAHFNEYGQPIGAPLDQWQSRPLPQRISLSGRFCRLEPLDISHSQALFTAWHSINDERDWTYLSSRRPATAAECDGLITANAASADPLHFAVIDLTSLKAVGSVALMRIDNANGVIEIGWVNWSPLMKRSACGTEAISLLLSYIFDHLGYRRCEWKCHSLNQASNRAARRLGFQYEGTFRQAVVNKGHSRDTCWYSIIDGEWPAVADALRAWLDNNNFSADGQQKRTLASLRSANQ